MSKCCECGAELSRDEIGLSKKLINRDGKRLKCIGCLASHYQVSEQRLHAMIAQFRAQGCTAFEANA
ncbi:MAG: hypothetical protein LBS96_02745 [Oscillospiraceae bacterium]|nr:hypothetical protein [Oscillospiraceae bacterium]